VSDKSADSGLTPSSSLLQTIARILRHEVGDLLQTVYSSVAIFQDRLTAEQSLERRLLADLKGRAENCKLELDAVVDLVSPVTLVLSAVDVAALAGAQVPAYRKRFPALRIYLEAPAPAPIQADGRRLAQVGPLLLLGACQGARGQVWVRVAPGPEEVTWSFTHDGPPAPPEQLNWLTEPFITTQHALFGLGVALARRIARLHGGSVSADNLPEGGVRVRMVLPVQPPEDGGRELGAK
jgi:signal transduction histidine kinase